MKNLNEISDEMLIRALTDPFLINLDSDEVNSLRGPDLDKLDDNAFLRSLTEPVYITD